MRLNLIALRVASLEASRVFYEHLGLRFEEHRHGSGPLHLSVEITGIVLELYAGGQRQAEWQTRVGFAVPSLDAVLAGVPADCILAPPRPSPWGRRAVLADPDGHRVELLEEPS
jgi:catechol 2,3-dioxygenase-like lactoylglutathione lyase family enzyme